MIVTTCWRRPRPVSVALFLRGRRWRVVRGPLAPVVLGIHDVLAADAGDSIALARPIPELALELVLKIRHFTLQAIDSLSGLPNQVGFFAFAVIGSDFHRAELLSHLVKLIFKLGTTGLTLQRR